MGDGRAAQAASQERSIPTVPAARRVLVPIDFSDRAAHAIPWAYALAGPGGAVVLLHVADPATPPNPLYAHYEPGHAASEEERRVQRAGLLERLRQLAPSGAAGAGVATEVEVVEDADVAAGIRDAAQRLRIDAICVASHCRGPLVRTLLGSIAESLLHPAAIPVFVVPVRRS